MSADAALARHGLRLQVSDAGGTGTPVVFQHGLCGDVGQTTEAFREDRRFRWLALECGHCGSELGPPSSFSIATFADDVAALIEDRARPPCMVGGISMGAAISLRLAVKRPDLVRALVLARPAWGTAAPDNMAPNALVGSLLASHAPDEARALLASETHAPLAHEAPDNLASLDGFFARAPLDVTAELLTRISADGPGASEEEVRAIVVPTLVVATASDFIHPLARAAARGSLQSRPRPSPSRAMSRNSARRSPAFSRRSSHDRRPRRLHRRPAKGTSDGRIFRLVRQSAAARR